jgi:hypothetical protein
MIGLIFGETDFPKQILKKITKTHTQFLSVSSAKSLKYLRLINVTKYFLREK